jgi:hypothetical protein
MSKYQYVLAVCELLVLFTLRERNERWPVSPNVSSRGRPEGFGRNLV